MGTSVNQSSPHTLNWKAAQAGYRDPSIPINRVTTEIWRAASNQPAGNLEQLLAHPIIAQIGALVERSSSSLDLSRKSALEIARSKHSSLATEIARRACLQVAGTKDWRRDFTVRLFAEATAYLVSRDLPGYVGLGRVHNVEEAARFKLSLSQHAADVVARVDVPREFTESSWASHVKKVVSHLRGGR
jgi:hypothetical protein